MNKRQPELNELEIIRDVLAGNVDRFEILVDRYKTIVFSIAGKRVPAEDLDETAHEIFISAYTSLDNFAGRSPFSHWLSSIAVRTCCDYWRKRYRSKEMPMSKLSGKHQDWLEATLADESSLSFESIESKRTARGILMTALNKLSPKDRAVIELVYLEEHSTAEAAELLGWSKSNVKVRAFRSRKKLRKIIEKMTKL